ncbi:DUF4124 domain-containing protein [Pseudomonas sp. N040]|uniref:DUF4124 domain-containing protein n=1 Tax=Pseudomonas sp. N040 TaxID=2785325 RepID=UPI0018A2796F|nr:DUF4124 domain-containing protein [Pseudomonas sp. N040]MBF7730438.1 DUF4124 domain-containing protein [Pseudomonas sp. N040]MBW7014081.1 DUF4124 domain-containing protein [Pseudomonas sp. N040]
MRRIALTGSLLLALSTQLMAAPPIYQWLDAAGQPHYGAQPPQGVQSTLVKAGSAKPKPAPTAAPAVANPTTAEDPQAAIDARVKQDVAKQQAEQQKRCESLRTNLAQLQNNPRISVEDKGQVRRLGEDERQAKIAQTQKAIQEECH